MIQNVAFDELIQNQAVHPLFSIQCVSLGRSLFSIQWVAFDEKIQAVPFADVQSLIFKTKEDEEDE